MIDWNKPVRYVDGLVAEVIKVNNDGTAWCRAEGSTIADLFSAQGQWVCYTQICVENYTPDEVWYASLKHPYPWATRLNTDETISCFVGDECPTHKITLSPGKPPKIEEL